MCVAILINGIIFTIFGFCANINCSILLFEQLFSITDVNKMFFPFHFTRPNQMRTNAHLLFQSWRVKVLRETDYEPVFSLRLSLADVLIAAVGLLFFTIFLTFFFIAYTPLREYLPGYSDPTLRKDLYALQMQTDSLLKETNKLHAWARSVQNQFEVSPEMTPTNHGR